MAYTDNSSTAWGEVTFKIGTPESGNTMSTSLSILGEVKEDSFSFETEDGKEYEWKGTGGRIVDSMKGEPSLKVKCVVKNLNKALLEKIWKVKETGDKLEVLSMTNNLKYSILIEPKTTGSEKISIPYSSISGKPIYSGDSGYEVEIEIKVLSGGQGKDLYTIERVA